MTEAQSIHAKIDDRIFEQNRLNWILRARTDVNL